MVLPSFRSALVLAGVLAGASAGGLGGAPDAVAASSGHLARAASVPATQLARPVCTTSLDDPQQRAATFSVRTSRGAASSFGFTAVLEEKPSGGAWAPLTGAASPAGLGVFQPAAEGSAAMVRRINVRGLRLGSAYRLKVSFRWVTATGKQRVTRRSAPCTVKEVRPNLGIIRALQWTPGTRGDQVVYRVQLRVHRFPTSWNDRKITISINQGATVLGQVSPAPGFPGAPSPFSHGALVLIPGSLCEANAAVTYRIEVAGPDNEESTVADNELTVPCGPRRASGR